MKNAIASEDPNVDLVLGRANWHPPGFFIVAESVESKSDVLLFTYGPVESRLPTRRDRLTWSRSRARPLVSLPEPSAKDHVRSIAVFLLEVQLF
jgi:hypothetical protein